MNSVLTVCLIAVAFHLVAIPAFIWAARGRQLRSSDQEAYRVVREEVPGMDGDAPEADLARPVSRTRMVVFFGAFFVMCAFIMWSLAITVVAAQHAPGAQTAQ